MWWCSYATASKILSVDGSWYRWYLCQSMRIVRRCGTTYRLFIIIIITVKIKTMAYLHFFFTLFFLYVNVVAFVHLPRSVSTYICIRNSHIAFNYAMKYEIKSIKKKSKTIFGCCCCCWHCRPGNVRIDIGGNVNNIRHTPGLMHDSKSHTNEDNVA